MSKKSVSSLPSIIKQPNKISQKKIVTFSDKPPQIRRITRLPTIILDFSPSEKKLPSDIPLPPISSSETEKTAIKECFAEKEKCSQWFVWFAM